MSQWICTDPSTAQWCRQCDDWSWAYMEARQVSDQSKWAVCEVVVDIRDYDMDELETYCYHYYPSLLPLDDMVHEYGFRGALQIMAECIFEQTPLDETCHELVSGGFEAAEKRVKEIVDRYHTVEGVFGEEEEVWD